MHGEELHHWQHQHSFGTAERAQGENRTRWVIALTFVMMTIEIAAGTLFGSMALLADGWGPRHLAAIVSVVSHEPREPGHYKQMLAGCLGG